MKTMMQVIAAAALALLAAPPALAEVVCDGQSDPGGKNEYENRSVDSSEYTVQLNYWNSAANSPAGPSTGDLCLDIDLGSGAFTVSTAPGSVPTNGGPTSYPSIFKGCHWGTLCTPTGTSNMPMKVSDITGLPSSWSITAADGIWDASYDIWFNTTPSSGSVGQNDGLEIMVWMNNSGYLASSGHSIQPSGQRRYQAVAIPGVQGTWDVWTSRLGGAADWNVVSFVKVDEKVTDFNFDGKKFIDYIRNTSGLKCPATTGDQSNPTAACIVDSWYLTSVQAGFEPWENGQGLASRSFKVAVTKQGTVSQDGRTGEDGTPIVYWGSPFDIVAPSCPGGTATYTMKDENGAVMYDGAGTRLENVSMSLKDNKFVATVQPLDPNTHGLMNVTINKSCGSETFSVYVDPSGNVQTLDGKALAGATVTLLRSTSAGGTFTPVPSGSSILAPYTSTNPQTSDCQGHFGWDVDLNQPAFYKVRAEKAGCAAPVESIVYPVPPPVTGIVLKLDCPTTTPGDTPGLRATVTTANSWFAGGTAGLGGFCDNVMLTNTTGRDIVGWQVTVPVQKSAVYTSWNASYSQPSPTQVRIRSQSNYLQTIQAGRSTSMWDLGFCVNRLP